MSHKHHSHATQDFNKLIEFRQAAYTQLHEARDALFELTDAILEMRGVHSLAELSCATVFRRQWSSVYEALQDGRPDGQGLLRLYLKHLPAKGRPILAGDHTAWSRLSAPTLAERSYQHQPSLLPGRRPVTLGHGYSTIAWVPEAQGSWCLPLLHERIHSVDTPVRKASQQLERVCRYLLQRPITVWDSEYSCARFVQATADLPADKIIRLRTNLCLEGPPRPYPGRGAHPKHGLKFKLRDPATWWPPDQTLTREDVEFGPIRVRIWHHLRFRQALDCPMTVAQIERPQAPATRRKPKLLWLTWIGEPPPPHWWGLYARRYPIDHWYRFAKGRLHWSLPMLATPEQGERWSTLMPFITWELWLARALVPDKPLPWQKPQPRPSPGRVCQGLPLIFAQIGTPAQAPKPRGNSPGWPKGRPRTPRRRFEVVRSEQWQAIRSRQWAKTTPPAA